MEWIKTSDRMPENGKGIVFSDGINVRTGHYDDGRYLKKPVGKWLWMGRIYHNPVTHWMPLPPPPTE